MRKPANASNKLPTWNCEAGQAEITVGSKFLLNCKGENVEWGAEGVAIYAKELDSVTNKASLNNLKILEVKNLSESGIEATVTSYLAGEYKEDGFFILTDGKTEVALQGVQFKVVSVLPPGQENKPYPAYPPWVMPIP